MVGMLEDRSKRPFSDVVEETRRLIEGAESNHVLLRAIGGVAVLLHCPSAEGGPLSRRRPDIDLMALSSEYKKLNSFIISAGYEPNKRFNAVNLRSKRLMYIDPVNQRQIDFLLDYFHMCHTIDVKERMSSDKLTIPLAELLLTKLQIVRLNEKDIRDTVALVKDHNVGEGDEETINLKRICDLCGKVWGLYKTVTANIAKIRDSIDNYEIGASAKELVKNRLTSVSEAVESTPKSMKWKMRAKVGESVAWYDLPEEVVRRAGE